MGRPKQSFEDSVVYDDLRYWGYYKGRQCAADGYSPENTIAHILSGQSGVVGHRVLVLDMTPRAWQINGRVMQQPTDNIAVLIGRFCLPVKADTGQPYEAREIADVLRIDLRTYWERLRRARDAYRSSLFGPALAALEFATA